MTKIETFREAEKRYCSLLAQFGENNRATIGAETTYRELKCARSACQRPHQDCVHTQTDRKYCAKCARAINEGTPQDPPLVAFPKVVVR